MANAERNSIELPSARAASTQHTGEYAKQSGSISCGLAKARDCLNCIRGGRKTRGNPQLKSILQCVDCYHCCFVSFFLVLFFLLPFVFCFSLSFSPLERYQNVTQSPGVLIRFGSNRNNDNGKLIHFRSNSNPFLLSVLANRPTPFSSLTNRIHTRVYVLRVKYTIEWWWRWERIVRAYHDEMRFIVLNVKLLLLDGFLFCFRFLPQLIRMRVGCVGRSLRWIEITPTLNCILWNGYTCID